jgi:D-alanyl-D-alanine carboxypeptidase
MTIAKEVCVAGEAPGREQQHETSGEAGLRPAADPRLAVFRASGKAPEPSAARDGHGDAADAAQEGRTHPPAPDETQEKASSEAVSGTDDEAPAGTRGAAGAAPRHPAEQPAPTGAGERPAASGTAGATLRDGARAEGGGAGPGGKTESNRDPADGTSGMPVTDGTPGAGAELAETRPAAPAEPGPTAGTQTPGGGEEADEVSGGEAGGEPEEPGADSGGRDAGGEARAGTEKPSTDKDASAPGGVPSAPAAPGRDATAATTKPAATGADADEEPEPVAVATAPSDGTAESTGESTEAGATPVAQPSRRTAGSREGGLPAQADTAPEVPPAPASGAASGTASGTAPKADEKAGRAAEPEDPADRTDAADAAGRTDSAGPEDPAKDAEAGEVPKDATAGETAGSAHAPSAPRKPVVKPLVSDLPAERPGGAEEGRQGAYSGPVTFGPPGTPTRADKGRKGSAKAAEGPRGAAAPLPPAQPVPARPPAAPGTRSANGTETAEGKDRETAGPEGTRRMPVPPVPDKKPMTLLAELTNTPPPPPTLLRTVLRRVKIWTPLVVLLAVVFVIVQAVRPLPSPSLQLTAAPTYTFPGASLPQSMPWPTEGQSVAEVEGLGSLGVHGAQTPVPIASVTKVMTAYVVLHDHPLSGKENGPTITVDAQAAQEATSEDQSTAPVKKGQKFTERQMLELLLVPSGNNIARLLARWDAGTQQAFVAKMTATAKSLGMTHTTYTGASGIEESTVSTAVDQLKLARQVMKNDVFRSVVALPNVDVPGVGRIYNNNNDLVKLGVVGIKTGSSTPAGGALMWAAHRTIDGKQQLILGVVLQQRGGKSTPADCLQVALDRSQALIDSVQNGLGSATTVHKGDIVGRVDDGLGGSTPVVAAKDLKVIGWPGMRRQLVLTPVAGGIPHNAKAGTQVGTLSFGDASARTAVPVTLQSDLHSPGFGAKLTRF